MMKEQEKNVTKTDMNGRPAESLQQEEALPLFDDAFFGKISRLKLAITKKSSLHYQGRRRSHFKGSSAEFSDFREYIPGDDVRRIDWNVYARLDKPYVREYTEEREAAVNIFLDLSASMAFFGKDRLAKQLAGAMALMSLSNQDRVGLHLIVGETLTSLQLSGSKGNARRALDAIQKAEPKGSGDLPAAVRSVSYLPQGISFLISDFLEESFLEKGRELLSYLSYRGQEPVLLQVMAREELEVSQTGSFRFEDAEGSFDPVSVSLDDRTLKAYEQECGLFLEAVKKTAAENRGRYFLCSTKDGFEKIVYENLRSMYQ